MKFDAVELKEALARRIAFLRAWGRPQDWGPGQRVLVPACAVALATAALATAFSASRFSASLDAERRAKGLAVAQSLAWHAQDLLRSADPSGVGRMVGEYGRMDGLRYAYLLDAQGAVLGHSFSSGFPEGLEMQNRPAAGSADAALATAEVQGHRCLDVAVPIMAGALGTAHVGVDLERGGRQVLLISACHLALLAACLALAAAWAWRRTHAALSALEEISRAAEAVEREGDLTWRSPAVHDRVTGRLAAAFEGMLRRLADLPREVMGQADALQGEFVQLDQQHLAQGEAIDYQAAALAQAHSTGLELLGTSKDAAAQARGLIGRTKRVLELGQRGSAAVQRSTEGLRELRVRVESLTAEVAELETRARSIQGIVDTVKDLADQSNMLALNAAIEALRAGDHGRGFGLVANEIRSLANRSVEATQRVRAVLEDLSAGIERVALNSREGAREIGEGLMKMSASALDVAEVQRSMDASVEQLQSIAAVVQHQDLALASIVATLAQQGQRMRDAGAMHRRSGEAVTFIRKVVTGLNNQIMGFRIRREGGGDRA